MILRKIAIVISVSVCSIMPIATEAANWNPMPDTGQTTCYDADGNVITCPAEGEPFYGQDANYHGPAPSFTDNGNETVTDNNTGLIWQKSNWYSSATGKGAFPKSR